MNFDFVLLMSWSVSFSPSSSMAANSAVVFFNSLTRLTASANNEALSVCHKFKRLTIMGIILYLKFEILQKNKNKIKRTWTGVSYFDRVGKNSFEGGNMGIDSFPSSPFGFFVAIVCCNCFCFSHRSWTKVLIFKIRRFCLKKIWTVPQFVETWNRIHFSNDSKSKKITKKSKNEIHIHKTQHSNLKIHKYMYICNQQRISKEIRVYKEHLKR